ncbi:MAG: redoxin domain-containing protein, partial [Planctomycetales bacterium]|nr:redoxin domain-containing protein [Planctomycetales bacterium]
TPLLVVFLRHSGCAFCRETLAQLARNREQIEAAGARIVLVHMMSDDAEAARLFARYGLDDVPRVSDPERRVYEQFGLARGSWQQVMGPPIWWRGFQAIFLRGHFPGVPRGDLRQLPGAFVVSQGAITRAFRAEDSVGEFDAAAMIKP